MKWILDLKQFSGHLARWRLRRMEFDFEIQHRPGQKHIAVDKLSSLLLDQPDESNLDRNIPTYKTSKVHAISDNKNIINVVPLTVQSFMSAQE